MTPQQIVGMGLRLFAIWIAIATVPKIFQAINGFAIPEVAKLSPGLLVASTIYLLLSVLLWNFPMWTAHKLVPRTSYDNKLNVSLYEGARVGSALIGLWIVATTLQNIVWFILFAMIASGSTSFFASMSSDSRISLFVDIFQVSIGAFLLIRSDLIARHVSREPDIPGKDADMKT